MTTKQLEFESRMILPKYWGFCKRHGIQRFWKRIGVLCPACFREHAYA